MHLMLYWAAHLQNVTDRYTYLEGGAMAQEHQTQENFIN